ncbi:MAG: polysaccharide deacetylase family protein [Nitrososphaerales archaeon]
MSIDKRLARALFAKGFAILVLLIIAAFPTQSYGQAHGSLEVTVLYTNGDRVNPWQMTLMLYRDSVEEPSQVVSTEMNPYTFPSLRLNHKYRVDVYVNDMFAGSDAVELRKIEEKLVIKILPPGGMRLNIFYSDGVTPIEGADVEIRSYRNNLIQSGVTDKEGTTPRFWLQSTGSQEYYIASIFIDNKLSYEHSQIKLEPGTRKEVKVVTSWPPRVEQLVFSLYEGREKVGEKLGKFTAIIYDNSEREVAAAAFNRKGDAYFTDLKVGEYMVRVYRIEQNLLYDEELWLMHDITLTDKQMQIDLLRNKPSIVELKSTNNIIPIGSATEVVFRISSTYSNEKNVTFSLILDRDRIEPYDLIQRLTVELTSGYSEHKIFVEPTEEGMYYGYAVIEHDGTVTGQLPWREVVEVKGNVSADITLSIAENELRTGENASLTYTITNTGTLPWQFYIRASLWNNGELLWERIDNTLLKDGEYSEFNVNLAMPAYVGRYDFAVQTFFDANLTHLLAKEMKGINTIGIELSDAFRRAPSSCNCVTFVLLDVQDYYAREAQIDIIKSFINKDTKLTLAVIGGSLENDNEIIQLIRNSTSTGLVEVANRGWMHNDHTAMTFSEQRDSIARTKEKVKSMFNAQTRTFMPPDDRFNDETIAAMKEIGITYLSSSLYADAPPYPLHPGERVFHFPVTASTSIYNTDDETWSILPIDDVFDDINNSVMEYGFAVVAIYPQSYYRIDGNNLRYQSEDVSTINDLVEIVRKKFSLVNVSEIEKQYWLPKHVSRNLPLYYYTLAGSQFMLSSSNSTITTVKDGEIFVEMQGAKEEELVFVISNDLINDPAILSKGEILPSMSWLDNESDAWIIYTITSDSASIHIIPEFGPPALLFAGISLLLVVAMRYHNKLR